MASCSRISRDDYIDVTKVTVAGLDAALGVITPTRAKGWLGFAGWPEAAPEACGIRVGDSKVH
jgi:hypothetical protein